MMPFMPAGARTLGQIAAELDMIEVRCRRCERAGRYRVAGLIERFGADKGLPALGEDLSADCPNRNAPLYQRCSVYFPNSPKPGRR